MSMHSPDPVVAFAFFLGALLTAALRDGGEILARVLMWRSQR